MWCESWHVWGRLSVEHEESTHCILYKLYRMNNRNLAWKSIHCDIYFEIALPTTAVADQWRGSVGPSGRTELRDWSTMPFNIKKNTINKKVGKDTKAHLLASAIRWWWCHWYDFAPALSLFSIAHSYEASTRSENILGNFIVYYYLRCSVVGYSPISFVHAYTFTASV